MKKLIALLLSLVMLLSMASFAAADENFNETGYPIVNEVIKPVAAGSFGLDIEPTEIITWAEWRERLGIEFDIRNYNGEDWSTQLTLMMASDEMPDILSSSGFSNAQMADYGSQGYFVNLLDYIDLMPNYQEAWETYPGLKGASMSPDGAIYGTKYITTSTVNKICRGFINNEWLERVGKEVPTTLDELYDVMVAFKEQDANGNGDPTDEIPMYDLGRTMTLILNAFGFNTDDWDGYNVLYADEEGKVYLADISDNYKAMLAWLNKCYTEGLILEEVFTITGKEGYALCEADRVGMYATGSAPFVHTTTDISTDASWSGLMALASEYNGNTRTLGIPSGISSSYKMSISADSEYIKPLVRFIDYVHDGETEEGGLSIFSGYEGVTFDYIYDDILQADVLTIRCPEGFASSDEFRQYKAVFNGLFLTYSGVPARNTLWNDSKTEILQTEEVLNKWGWMAQLTYASRNEDVVQAQTFPVELMSYTEDELNDRVTLNTDINTYLQQAFANFVMGTWNLDTDWETHLATLESMGLSRLLEIEQASYDRYLGK